MILYSDEHILAIDKPSGLLSIPDGYNRSLPTVQSTLEPAWGKLYIVHRLDKDTSGVLLLARSAEAHRLLDRQFARHEVEKVYHALCAGAPPWNDLLVDLPLRVNGDRSHRTVVDSLKGKPAWTDLQVLRRFEGFCLIEARPRTGYTHQIRAHLSSIGLPLLGDPLYRIPNAYQGPRPDLALAPAFQRTALHAVNLAFHHPVTLQRLELSAPCPPDFQQLLSGLK